tara:strand:+ start:78 stop:383 length:306 start_codon:yes stop_codon:yes gene_type:complete
MEKEPLKAEMLEPHGTTIKVMVDDFKSTIVIGTFGAYSDRLNISFETPHPEFGKTFSTKYFRFIESGVIEWGHDGRTFNVVTTGEESTFDNQATSHPFSNE